MQLLTSVVILCLLASSQALPSRQKYYHKIAAQAARHLPTVVDVEHTMKDTRFGFQPAGNQNLESDQELESDDDDVDDDEPQLESDEDQELESDAEQDLESDADQELESDADQELESDADQELESDSGNNAEFEEDEDEEETVVGEDYSAPTHESSFASHSAMNAKVITKDIENVRNALATSGLSAKIVKEAKANLDQIDTDVSALSHASQERASRLKEAIGLRIQALKLMVGDNVPALGHRTNTREFEEEEEEDEDDRDEVAAEAIAAKPSVLSRVEDDVSTLESQIRSSHRLSAASKKRAIADLDAIRRDAESYHTATSSKGRELLHKAINKRVDALKLILK